MSSVNAEQAAYWAARAESWASREAFHDSVIGPAGRLAMDRLDPRPGWVVADLGCGTGRTTVELARRVAPDGRVVGVDIAAAMLDRARQHVSDSGVSNVALVQADVQNGDLGQDRFAGAFSRFGVMFFSDPVAAFANVHTSLERGAVLSFACWQSFVANEWMSLPARAAGVALGVQPESPSTGAPGPFSLADPERVQGILGAAGFRDIDVEGHRDLLVIPGSGIAEVAESSLHAGPVQRMLEGADAHTVELARQAIGQELESRLEGGEVALSRAFNLVLAVA